MKKKEPALTVPVSLCQKEKIRAEKAQSRMLCEIPPLRPPSRISLLKKGFRPRGGQRLDEERERTSSKETGKRRRKYGNQIFVP